MTSTARPESDPGPPGAVPKDPSARVATPPPEGWSRARAARLTVVLGAAWLASFLFPPERLDSLPPLCLWKTLSGVPCPFCGLTHSVVALSHGQFRAAFELNPFGPVVYLSGIVLLAITAFILLRGGPPSVGQRLGRALRIVAITVPVLWALWWLAATAGILPR